MKKTNFATILSWRIKQLAGRIFVKNIKRIVSNSIIEYKKLVKLRGETFSEVLPNIRHSYIQLATIKYWEECAKRTIRIFYFLFAIGAFFILPFQIQAAFNGIGNKWLIFLFNFIAFYIMWLLLKLLDVFLPRRLKQFSPAILCGIEIVFALGLYTNILNFNPILQSLFLVLLGQIAFFVIFLIAFTMLTLNRNVFRRISASTFPEAMIIDALISILSTLAVPQKDLGDIRIRQEILEKLEFIAICVQKHLYKKLNSGDALTDNWFWQTTSQLAMSIRLKKLWILTPKSDTKEYFIKTISEFLISVCHGDWDAIEKSEPPIITARYLWLDKTKNVAKDLIKSVLMGGFPILALWGIQKSPLAFSTPISDYAVGGVMLWAIFSVLIIFDPSFKLKLDAIKDLLPIKQ